MRILLISSEFPPGPGGIGTHAYQLSKQFIRIGAQVLVVTNQDYEEQDQIIKFNNEQSFSIVQVKNRPLLLIKAFEWIKELWRWTAFWSPDIILSTGTRSSWVTAILAKIHRVPWLAVGHGSEFGGMLNIAKRLTRWAFNQADAVVCVSQYTRKVMHKFGVAPKKEKVITNGADDENFFPDKTGSSKSILKEFGLDVDNFVLLTVGNVSERKGQEVVIRALKKILYRHPGTHYLLAGLPTEKAKMDQLSADLGLQDHVHILGKIDTDTLLRLYQACDLFVMTSRRLFDGDVEGFGISVIEAAMCGKPAVVSRESGLAEAVVDGITGLYVPENNPDKTAEVINHLLENLEDRLLMGEKALQRARRRYTWKVVGQKYFNFIQEVCKKSGKDQ